MKMLLVAPSLIAIFDTSGSLPGTNSRSIPLLTVRNYR